MNRFGFRVRRHFLLPPYSVDSANQVPQVEHACVSPLPTRQRPINLLPMLCRLWSSTHCSFLPSGFFCWRSCRKLELKLACCLEDCMVDSRPLSGLLPDVGKALNALPRAPCFQIRRNMSVPESVGCKLPLPHSCSSQVFWFSLFFL